MSYDPEVLEREREESMKGIPGEILSIEESTAGEIFGDAAREPARDVILVSVKVADADSTEFEEVFSLPKGPKSWANAQFKLGRYEREYGNLPRVGDEVLVTVNADGFYRIRL